MRFFLRRWGAGAGRMGAPGSGVFGPGQIEGAGPQYFVTESAISAGDFGRAREV